MYKKIMCLSLLVFASFFLASCVRENSKSLQESKEKDRVMKIDKSTTSETSTSSNPEDSQLIAEEFMSAYMNQKFDLTDIERRKSKLLSLLSEKTQQETTILADLETFKQQLDNFQTKKELNTSSSAVLVERKIDSLDVYKKEDKYLADVVYSETSPVVTNAYQVHKQFSFEVVNRKIENLKEIEKE